VLFLHKPHNWLYAWFSCLCNKVTQAQYTPPTPTRRRRDSTRQLSRVGVGGVYWVLSEAFLNFMKTVYVYECRSLIGCMFVPRDDAIYCAQCSDLNLHVTSDIKVKVGGCGDSVTASNESLTGASRDNVMSRQAAITSNHAPPLLRSQSPDGSSSYFAGCSLDGESPRQGHVTARRRGGGRGFAASHGKTSRYLDDDNDDDDSDQSEVYQRPTQPPRPSGRPSASSRGKPQPRPEPSEWRSQRRRAKPRARTRRGVQAVGPRNFEGYTSDTPAASGLTPAGTDIRCSGYSSDSIDPTTSVSLQRRRGRRVVSTGAQTTGNDVTDEHGGTGSGSGRLVSDSVRRYLEAAAAWDDDRHGCSTCSSSSTDSSSEFDYYLDRPLSTSGLGWSSSATASPLHAPKCSSAVKQCIVS